MGIKERIQAQRLKQITMCRQNKKENTISTLLLWMLIFISFYSLVMSIKSPVLHSGGREPCQGEEGTARGGREPRPILGKVTYHFMVSFDAFYFQLNIFSYKRKKKNVTCVDDNFYFLSRRSRSSLWLYSQRGFIPRVSPWVWELNTLPWNRKR